MPSRPLRFVSSALRSITKRPSKPVRPLNADKLVKLALSRMIKLSICWIDARGTKSTIDEPCKYKPTPGMAPAPMLSKFSRPVKLVSSPLTPINSVPSMVVKPLRPAMLFSDALRCIVTFPPTVAICPKPAKENKFVSSISKLPAIRVNPLSTAISALVETTASGTWPVRLMPCDSPRLFVAVTEKR